MQRLFFTLGYLFITTFLFGQQIIQLQNPSFEDTPQTGKAPVGWYNCGFPGESEPDVQPNQVGSPFFGVIQSASDGNTYIGMVVRDNATWEMVGQRLATSIEAGKIYSLTVDLCRSTLYESMSRKLNMFVNYATPAKLRIWAGNDYCAKTKLLTETPLVMSSEWLTYNLVIKPTQDFTHLTFECFYKTPVELPSNGNLLMDNLSPIVKISAETADSLENLIPQEVSENLALSATQGTATNRPSNIPSLLDTDENTIRKWSTFGNLTDTLRTFLQEMDVDWKNEQLTENTKIQLQKMLAEVSSNDEYNTIVFGVSGKNSRRKLLSEPIYNFILDNNLTTDRLKLVKVKVGELDKSWVGKNGYYWLRVE